MEGNPAPTFAWKKGGREVPLTGRVRCTTDGDTGQVSLIISKCRPQDEGEYTLEVKNSHGKDSVEAKLLVTSGMESNLDFRTKLKKRDTSISEKQKSESEDRPKSEAERRLKMKMKGIPRICIVPEPLFSRANVKSVGLSRCPTRSVSSSKWTRLPNFNVSTPVRMQKCVG